MPSQFHFVEEVVGFGDQVVCGGRLDLVHDEQRELTTLLRHHQRLVFFQIEIIVVVVFTGQELKTHAGFCVPAVDVKHHPIFSEHHIAGDLVAAGAKQFREQVAGLEFGEGVRHRRSLSLGEGIETADMIAERTSRCR